MWEWKWEPLVSVRHGKECRSRTSIRKESEGRGDSRVKRTGLEIEPLLSLKRVANCILSQLPSASWAHRQMWYVRPMQMVSEPLDSTFVLSSWLCFWCLVWMLALCSCYWLLSNSSHFFIMEDQLPTQGGQHTPWPPGFTGHWNSQSKVFYPSISSEPLKNILFSCCLKVREVNLPLI